MCDSLNVRSAASLSRKVVVSYWYGESIYSIAADTLEADGCVLAHYTACSGAMHYVAICTANGSEKYLVKA